MFRKKNLAFILVLTFLLFIFCGKPEKVADLRGELAAISGRMAKENDLREVRFADLNGDGNREVIMVFGPRDLLDFDVYYQGKGGEWMLTPLVNDQNNPREFISTRLDSIRDINGDKILEISVSSRLYDGNTMVKELHWDPRGYKVISQRTVLAQPEKPREPTPAVEQKEKTASEGTLAQKSVPTAEKKSKPESKPKARKVPPAMPATGTYLIKKGDTIYAIAASLSTSLAQLEALNENQLISRGLRIGQKINVPVPSGKRKNITVRIERERYTVKAGDNLISIARNYDISVAALKSWNPSLPEDGSINSGQVLNIHQAIVDIKP